MRPRKQKHLDERLTACRHFLWEVPGTSPITGSRYGYNTPQTRPETLPEPPFGGSTRPLWVEIGCGKGQMLYKLAQAHPEWDFLGLEREPKVLLTALERAAGLSHPTAGKEGKTGERVLPSPSERLNNLKFVMSDADLLPYLLGEQSVDCFYVTFSDPWPKNRHAERRLTHRHRLEIYNKLLRPKGQVRFKSDNEGLFRFSLEEFQAVMSPYFVTENLHDSIYAKENIPTEYELYFSRQGLPIYAIYAEKPVCP